MNQERDVVYVEHILECIDRLKDYTQNGRDTQKPGLLYLGWGDRYEFDRPSSCLASIMRIINYY